MLYTCARVVVYVIFIFFSINSHVDNLVRRLFFLLQNLVFGCQIFCRLYQPVRNYFLCLVNLCMSVNLTAVEVLWIGWWGLNRENC